MHLRRRTVIAATLASLATPHVARASARQFRLGHNNSTDSVLHAAAVGFDRALRETSDGRLSLDILPNSALGSEAQMLQAVADGTLDATIAPTGTTAALVKDVGLLEMPYLFRDAGHARTALDGALGRHCAEALAGKGITVVAFSEVGIRHITANKPIRSIAELRGLKIRVPVSPAIMVSFRAMGAAADALAFPQLPEALRTGRFDAQENPVNIIVAARLNQFQSHLSLTGHVYTPAAIAVSNDVMEELTPADRALVLAAGQPGAAAARRLADRMEDEGLGLLRSAGMTVVTEIDQAGLRAAAAASRDQLAGEFGADAVRRIAALAA
jgi:tripartite ATP-independent transporter DctP family solute receptor